MKNRFENLWILQVLLVIGIVYLASQDIDGWGWLVFALLCTL
jgi:hypothetical protein